MDKETIGCHVSCDPFGNEREKGEFRGPWTHCRSEGTFVLSQALNFARHGHQVTIMGYKWVDRAEDFEKYPLPENVVLKNEISGKYDIYIESGWDNTCAAKRCEKINANIYIHHWGGSPWGSHLLDYIYYMEKKGIKVRNHLMARPSRAFWKSYDGGKDDGKIRYPFGIYAPIPLVERIKNSGEKGNFDSGKMLFANRGAFNKGYAENSEKVLEFMEKWQNSYRYKVLLWGDIKNRALDKRELVGGEIGLGGEKGTDIIRRFEKLKNKKLIEPYIGIGHDEFLRKLDSSKILLENGHGQEHIQNLEAICMGCIPLIWKGGEHHFWTSCNDNGEKVNELYGMDGIDGVDMILNDEVLYQKYFKDLAESIRDHEWDNSYKIFIDEIRKKIIGE